MRSDQVSELVMTRSQSQGQRGLPRVVAGPVVGPCTDQRVDCAEIIIAHGNNERRVAVVGVVDRVRHGGTNTGGEVRYEYMILKYEYKPIHTQKIPSSMYSHMYRA